MNALIDILIVMLLPLTALFTVLQRRPYHALVLRGIMGAVAVLLYAVLGAPDVALTEALVGTLLTVVLYAIAVRSSLALRLGALAAESAEAASLKHFCRHHDLALRQILFENRDALTEALLAGRVDVVRIPAEELQADLLPPGLNPVPDSVIVLAPHGRWHEMKMKQLFKNEETVIRVGKDVLERGALCAGST